MKTPRRITLFASAAPLLLSACTAPGGTPDASADEPGNSQREAKTVPEAPAEIPDAVWVAILSHLEKRLGTPVVDPTVVTAVAETWTDGSLGCPAPGQSYTQALVDGYRVVLEIDREQYDYRVGSGTHVRLCENPPSDGA